MYTIKDLREQNIEKIIRTRIAQFYFRIFPNTISECIKKNCIKCEIKRDNDSKDAIFKIH